MPPSRALMYVQVTAILDKKRAIKERNARKSEIKAERAFQKRREMTATKVEEDFRRNQRKLLRKSKYLTLKGSIFRQCSNSKVPWRGGHTEPRGTENPAARNRF